MCTSDMWFSCEALPFEAVAEAWALATATLMLLVRLAAFAAATACALSAAQVDGKSIQVRGNHSICSCHCLRIVCSTSQLASQLQHKSTD